MNENESIEFKENYTEKIYKEIIAFLNTNSGTIYIGYDDNGNLIGVGIIAKTLKKRFLMVYEQIYIQMLEFLFR